MPSSSTDLMDVHVLIDSIVRQTTVLIAELATSGGARAPLAHVANRVFLDLASELRAQGLGQKVIADMFGMALRTYHEKVRRLSESRTDSGRSLWEAVLEYVQEHDTLPRAEVLRRFRQDDPATVRAVLRDLVDSGLLFVSGRSDGTAYRARSREELESEEPKRAREALVSLVWVALNRYAPLGADELARAIPLDENVVRDALEELVQDGRARRTGDGEASRYDCAGCVIPLESPVGWEAAVFDHFQALVTALCAKVRSGRRAAGKDDRIGGSTYGFDVWQGHPHRDEVLGFLRRVREQAVELREKVRAYNLEHPAGAEPERVIAYVGQTLLGANGAPQENGEGEDA